MFDEVFQGEMEKMAVNWARLNPLKAIRKAPSIQSSPQISDAVRHGRIGKFRSAAVDSAGNSRRVNIQSKRVGGKNVPLSGGERRFLRQRDISQRATKARVQGRTPAAASIPAATPAKPSRINMKTLGVGLLGGTALGYGLNS